MAYSVRTCRLRKRQRPSSTAYSSSYRKAVTTVSVAVASWAEPTTVPLAMPSPSRCSTCACGTCSVAPKRAAPPEPLDDRLPSHVRRAVGRAERAVLREAGAEGREVVVVHGQGVAPEQLLQVPAGPPARRGGPAGRRSRVRPPAGRRDARHVHPYREHRAGQGLDLGRDVPHALPGGGHHQVLPPPRRSTRSSSRATGTRTSAEQPSGGVEAADRAHAEGHPDAAPGVGSHAVQAGPRTRTGEARHARRDPPRSQVVAGPGAPGAGRPCRPTAASSRPRPGARPSPARRPRAAGRRGPAGRSGGAGRRPGPPRRARIVPATNRPAGSQPAVVQQDVGAGVEAGEQHHRPAAVQGVEAVRRRDQQAGPSSRSTTQPTCRPTSYVRA